jgi:hypothetical protein
MSEEQRVSEEAKQCSSAQKERGWRVKVDISQ